MGTIYLLRIICHIQGGDGAEGGGGHRGRHVLPHEGARGDIFPEISSFILFCQAVVDFSNGISVEENTILMKTPRFSNVAHFDIFVIPLSICSQSQSKQWWAPFSPPVWLSIGLASISMALLMFLLISRIEIKVLPDPPPKAMGPLQIVWFIFGALVKQVG